MTQGATPLARLLAETPAGIDQIVGFVRVFGCWKSGA
jgi:hypothetical protein